MAKQQYVEGELRGCRKALCPDHCCNDGQVEEWYNEYFAFHERSKDYLIDQGIKIVFDRGRVRFLDCSDGKNCKFLVHSLNKEVDPRPIDCKIYPYEVDWESIDFDNKVVNLYYWDDACPVVRQQAVSNQFKKVVAAIIKRDFAVLFYGARFEVKFYNQVRN